jgi:hypothetical protein
MLRLTASSSFAPNGRFTRDLQSRGRSIGHSLNAGRSAESPLGCNDRLTHRAKISGLDRTASALAVYASPWRSPATTQDSLPAAGQALLEASRFLNLTVDETHEWPTAEDISREENRCRRLNEWAMGRYPTA